MHFFLPLLLLLSPVQTGLPFQVLVDAAFEALTDGDAARAATLLDEAARMDADAFGRNNLAYVRGRIALQSGDWARAEEEFSRIPTTSVLAPMVTWHRAAIAIRQGRDDDAITHIDRLDSVFPVELRLTLAATAGNRVALAVYDNLDHRMAVARKARLQGNRPGLWQILEDSPADDLALEVAFDLDDSPLSPDPDERMLLARTFHGHRVFDRAARLYRTLSDDEEFGPEASYELGRTFFLRDQYEEAIALFQETARRFPETDWALDAEVQVAAAHWRKQDFPAAEAAYLGLIGRTDDADDFQSFVRDLVDIYRSQGRIEDALLLIERGLGSDPPATARGVLLFSRAKTLFHEGRYAEALIDFQQLGRLTLRVVPNGTTREEVRFLESLALERLDRIDQARSIWSELAEDPFTFYGLHALARLGPDAGPASALERDVWRAIARDDPAPSVCRRPTEPLTRRRIHTRTLTRTRGLVEDQEPDTDLVRELIFLRQWDEAWLWAGGQPSRWPDAMLADLAYAAGAYRSAILYADRTRQSDDALVVPGAIYDDDRRILIETLYPATYADILCEEAAAAVVDPLWLRAIMYQESRYDARARSGAAARGLMQFIPETADMVGDRLGMGPLPPDQLYIPEISIRLGAHHWAGLMEEFSSPVYALAAYNGGPVNVRRWQAKMRDPDPAMFVSEIGFMQTKDYVSRIFGLYARYLALQ
jgi:soluble lytic murein transglycosylase